MKRLIHIFLFLIFLTTFMNFSYAERAIRASKAEAFSEQKVALIIGNGSYKSSPLKNPPNDAEDVARKLKALDFTVTKLINANQIQMRKAIRRFGKQLKKGGVGLFYYAGHGMQVHGINYLIPVGAEIMEEDEVQDYAVDAGMVLRKMQTAENRLNMVFLDACRNNPFARSFRSSSRGLAQMDAPSGSMICYATSPGRTAADGTGRNGVFTKHLLKQLDKAEGLELTQIMKYVGKGVQKETRKKQVPWISSSVTGDFYFIGEGAIKIDKFVSTGGSSTLRINDEEEFWIAIKNSKSADDYKDYISAYPSGRFVKIANIKIRQLSSKKPVTTLAKGTDSFESTYGSVRSKVLMEDTFSGNKYGWTMWPNGEKYITDIKSGKFVMETLNKYNSAEFPAKILDLPDTFEIEVNSTWIRGVDDRSYGVTIGSNRQNRYNFGVSGNGWSFVSGYKNNEVIDPSPMPWKSGTAIIGDGYKSNRLKIKVKGTKYEYYVNDTLVGTVFITIPHDKLKIGFFVENKQRVHFDNLMVMSGSSRPKSMVLFDDAFSDNKNSWTMWPKGEKYITNIKSGKYVMETLNTLNSAEFPAKRITLPENFSIEVNSTWKKGVDDRSYGIAIGSDRQNRYNFGVSGNGWSFVSGYKDNKVIDPAPMPWKNRTAIIGDGYKSNKLRVEARGSKFEYYVNDILVGTVFIYIPHDELRFGFFVENMQQAHFDNLKVVRR